MSVPRESTVSVQSISPTMMLTLLPLPWLLFSWGRSLRWLLGGRLMRSPSTSTWLMCMGERTRLRYPVRKAKRRTENVGVVESML